MQADTLDSGDTDDQSPQRDGEDLAVETLLSTVENDALEGGTAQLDEDEEEEECSQSFATPGYSFYARYKKARNGHWMSVNCTDSAVQKFHPNLVAGLRVLTTATAVSVKPQEPSSTRRPNVSEPHQPPLLVPSLIVGVADGFLWRFEDGASGITSFAATTREHLEKHYCLVIPTKQRRSTLRNVTAVPVGDEEDPPPASRQRLVVQQPHSAAHSGPVAASGPHVQVHAQFPTYHAEAKRRRTWHPTRTGNSWFDYSHDEDADEDVCSFALRAKSDLKALFGHKKLPFVFFAPISGKEASRGTDFRPLFPMICEYDISPSCLQTFKVSRGAALMVRKGNRAGRVMFVVGVLHGRLVLFEDGCFPIECDPSFPFSSLDAVPIEGIGGELFERMLDSLNFAFPRQAEAHETADTSAHRAQTAMMHASMSLRQAPAAQDASSDLISPRLSCCGHTFDCSASHLFYQFGWLPLSRVGHRKGPRCGTTGVVLGTLVDADGNPTTSSLWEFNESAGKCLMLEGTDKHTIEQRHMLELIGYRSAPQQDGGGSPEMVSGGGGALLSNSRAASKRGEKLRPSVVEVEATSSSSCTATYFPLSEPPYARFLCDSASAKAISAVTPVFPWNCDVGGDTSGGGGLGRSSRSTLFQKYEGSNSLWDPATIGQLASPPDSPSASSSRAAGAARGGQTVQLPLDTRWSSLVPHGLGVHGSVVEIMSGAKFGKLGIVLGEHAGDVYVLWDQQNMCAAVPVTPSLRMRIRWVPHIAPKPVMFSPPVPFTHPPSTGEVERHRADTVAPRTCVATSFAPWTIIRPAVNGMLVSVDASWQATWRFGLVHGQQLIFCRRSDLSLREGGEGQEELALHPLTALRLPSKESMGWRVGTVAGVFHSELFLWMHDSQLLEPLTGRCEGELHRMYCFAVFGPWMPVRTLEDVLLDKAHVGTASQERVIPRPLPELAHLSLYHARTRDATASHQGLETPFIALLDTSEAACTRISVLLEEGGGTVRCGVVTHGARLRQQVRIDPIRISRQRWRSFASDHWCTIVGVCDGKLMACPDDDQRFVVPLDVSVAAEVVHASNATYVAAPKLPAAVTPAFCCMKSVEEGLLKWQEVLRQATELTQSQKSGNSRPLGGGGASRGSAALKNLQSAQAWQQKQPHASQAGLPEEDVVPYDGAHIVRPQCDDAAIRALNTTDDQVREARMLCQTMPQNQLVDILQWVLEVHGVHLRDGETLSTALRLFAGVIRTTLVGNDHPVAEERYSCELPTIAQWCRHQRERLVSAEMGNRDYCASQEKLEREKMVFDERARYERLKSIFDDDDPVEEEEVDVGQMHAGNTAGLLSRASSFASTASRRLSRKPTNNLKQIFANKWRRSLDVSVLNSVVSASFLPATMRQRILSSVPLVGNSPPKGAAGSTSGEGSLGLQTRSESMTAATLRLLAESRQHNSSESSDDDEEGERHESDDGGGGFQCRGGGGFTREQLRKRQEAAESRAMGVLEQLSTFPSWSMRYTLHSGVQITFDISFKACEVFGLYHGQQFEVTRGDLAGEVVTILGVHRRQLWRYSNVAEAMPFDGNSGPAIVAQHGLQLVLPPGSSSGASSDVQKHHHVRRADPFFYPVHPTGELLRMDPSEKATLKFGPSVLFGQRYLVTAKRIRQSFQPTSAVTTTSSSCPPDPPTVVILGVCASNKLWIAPVEIHGGVDGNHWARAFHLSSSHRPIDEEWGLVFLYTAPVTIRQEFLQARMLLERTPTTTPSTTPLSIPLQTVTSGSHGAVLATPPPYMDAALYRERKLFRYRNTAGEVLVFDTSVSTCVGAFGVRFGDRILLRKPAKLCGKICVILGVREKKLWKVDERDSVATVLPKCKHAADLQKEYAIKVVGHQLLREFIG